MTEHAYKNQEISNALQAFNGMTLEGTQYHKFKHSDTNPETHIQGMSYYGSYTVFAHNQTEGPGYFLFGNDRNDTSRAYDVESPKDYHHPGGVQAVGDFLVVGIEKNESNNNSSWVQFYFIGSIKDNEPPSLLKQMSFQRANLGAAACGMTYADGHYVLCVYTSKGSKITVYKSTAGTLNDGNLTFSQEFEFQAKDDAGRDVGYDNLAMITDTAQKTYLIGFRGDEKHGHIEDYAELIHIDVAQGRHDTISTRHFKCHSTGGMIGVHFRYGATGVTHDGHSLLILASARHFELTGTPLNHFGSL